MISEEDLKGLIAQEGESLGILEPVLGWTRWGEEFDPGRLRVIASCFCRPQPKQFIPGQMPSLTAGPFRYVVMHRHVYATYDSRELFSFFCGQCECGRVYWAGPYPATEAMLREF